MPMTAHKLELEELQSGIFFSAMTSIKQRSWSQITGQLHEMQSIFWENVPSAAQALLAQIEQYRKPDARKAQDAEKYREAVL